jgi:8-oxo-dGTP pyrophosphatase MutT (NUDIX family)
MILVDIPIWAAHGTVFAHLVSDTSFEELHDFAARIGLPRAAFDGDHYDISQQRFGVCVAAGARFVGVAVDAVTTADIDLVASSKPTPDAGTGAAATVVRDRNGSFLVVRSIRRGSWDCPGGRREPGESVLDCARRELAEETGLTGPAEDFVVCGYERITVHDPGHWAAARPLAQIFRLDLAGVQPAVTPGDDVDGALWVDHDEFRDRCRRLFWWPLVAYLFELSL